MNYYIIIICIIIISFIILLLLQKRDTFTNSSSNILLVRPDEKINTMNIINNNIYSSGIPLNIFMTWDEKDLSLNMKKSVEIVKLNNPEFNVYIYDDKDCRNFIKKYFISDVVNAFDGLIPLAYKADLWRYCVLYYYGGIYQDIKYQPFENFKYISLLDKEYFVKDREVEGGGGIYNAFMVCRARNEILYKCIKQIIENVKNKFYGSSALEPTGPLLIKQFLLPNTVDILTDGLHFNIVNGSEYIFKNNKIILKCYNTYREEQKKSLKPHYHYLWNTRNIYI